MKRLIALIVAIIIALALVNFQCNDNIVDPPPGNPPGYQEDIPWPSLDENPWAIHHGNSQFTGRSRYPGPTEGRVEWKIRIPTFQVNDDTYLSPIVGQDSTFYFTSFQDTSYPHSFLHSFDFNGNEKWKFPLPYDGNPFSKTTAPPIITSDGKIYAADWSGNLYSISIEGEIIGGINYLWQY